MSKTSNFSFTCDVISCSKVFNNKRDFERHGGTHLDPKDRTFKCTHEGCAKAFYRPDRLAEHVTAMHIKSMEIFRCEVDQCTSWFNSEEYLWKHKLKNHPGPDHSYKCSFCPVKFTKKWQIKEHEANHTNTKPFRCNECNLEFADHVKYKKHQKDAHLTKTKTYSCSKCSETFNLWSTLRKHLKNEHPNPKEFLCQICNQVFSTNSYLKFHKKIHSETRETFKCTYDGCPRFYYHQRNLNQHVKSSHEGNGPICLICHKKFATKQKLELHGKLHDPNYIPKKKKNRKRSGKKLVKHLFSAQNTSTINEDDQFDIKKPKRTKIDESKIHEKEANESALKAELYKLIVSDEFKSQEDFFNKIDVPRLICLN